MEDHILGLHHITAITRDAQRNFDFYSKVLGLRFIKKTVNFDDPGTYHFYFGNETGAAGTIITFFPWPHITPGRVGAGQVTEIGYSVPAGSFAFWMQRFEEHKVSYDPPGETFGEPSLSFRDPDGMRQALIVAASPDQRTPWTTDAVPAEAAIRGFHTVLLTLADRQDTAALLTEAFGYTLQDQHDNRFRYATDAVQGAARVDIVEIPGEKQGVVASGSVHHVAFRVKDDAHLMRARTKITRRGLNITPLIDRQYFHSLYFREPGGVLFELATDNPGFTVDEPLAELGTHLLLPPQYEGRREQIEARLPPIS